jgi:hypothetical protein
MKRFGVLLLAVSPWLTFAAEDTRQLIQMPAEARTEMRAEMLDFQSALHQIVDALASGKSAEAADIAETKIGVSAMGRHRNSPPNARPGMFMPADMHAIARNMHFAASEFAKTARTGDLAKSLVALQPVMGACVACHRSYRTQ